jgi:hypothetical protein
MVEKMRAAKTVALILARLFAGAILLLATLDCFAPASMDKQAMECCASMPCHPANLGHDCCKSSTAGPVYAAPPPSACAAPALLTAGPAALFALARPWPPPKRVGNPARATAHAPPLELYTLHLSLLI